MDFNERLEMYLEGGLINENDVKNVNSILNMFEKKYHVVLNEENAATFIAHVCAAYSRIRTNEPIEELSSEVKKQLEALKTYSLSLEILENVLKVTDNPICDIEKDYFLLHINNLISTLKVDNQ